MCNASGQLVESSDRAEVFAHHLSNVQWCERPVADRTRHAPDDTLPINLDNITQTEVEKAVQRLKNGRAVVGAAAEALKAVMRHKDSTGALWLTRLMQLCWETKSCPSSWHLAQVKVLYKKGNPEECDNYRPISLLSGLYKVYASILLERLKSGGAESKLWPTQFGFRRKRSTEDALFIARRKIEQAWAAKNGRVHLLALDWRKAFDCISPARLTDALFRFGLPQQVCDIISGIHSERQFFVVENGVSSALYVQHAVIRQACPLSPFLFGIVMMILMRNAYDLLSSDAKLAHSRGELGEVLYADDTLILGSSHLLVQEYMAAVQKVGLEYGLEIHWGKVHDVGVCTDQSVRDPSGNVVQSKESMVYLGSSLHSSGRSVSEISRRIGGASADFRALTPIWKHTCIPMARKLYIFQSVVVSKLLYSAASCWFWKKDLQRLDGFYCNCIRKILKIPHSYFSRVSNASVLQRASCLTLSDMIKKAQLKLFDAVLEDPDKAELRRAAFHGQSQTPESAFWVRRRGRPRQNWTEELQKERLDPCR